MSTRERAQLTELMSAAGQGDSDARDQLWHLIYEELKRIARRQMASERPNHTLQTTVLVHEAYLRLLGHDGHQWANRFHFFAAVAEAMRRICVDDARKRRRLKRGGGASPWPMVDEPPVFDQDPCEVLAVNDALANLEEHASRQAAIVKLRYFCGLTGEETAEILGVSPRTVDADWRMARAWLHRALSGFDTGDA